MIEIIIFLALLFLVFVFFYKQSSSDFNILQIEASNLSTLSELLEESSPIVIRGLGPPTLLTPETLRTNSRIQTFPVSEGISLSKWLDSPPSQILATQPQEMREQLAEEVGVSMWANHTWFSALTESSWFSFLQTLESQVFLGSMGMQKTTALQTLIYPTSGTFTCSLTLGTATKFLPENWEGRFLADLRPSDSPLLHEIEFLDIILRPGTVLIVPPHWIVSMKSNNDTHPIFAYIELQNPISKLATVIG